MVNWSIAYRHEGTLSRMHMLVRVRIRTHAMMAAVYIQVLKFGQVIVMRSRPHTRGFPTTKHVGVIYVSLVVRRPWRAVQGQHVRV